MKGSLISTSKSAEGRMKPMRLLILGGTGFIGRASGPHTLARGHHVTIFNRGSSEGGLSSAQ